MLKKIFILPGIIAGFFSIAIYSFPQLSKTINYMTAAGTTEVSLGWSVKEDPGEAVQEAIAMALNGRRNKALNIAIMFVNADNNMRVIQSKAKKILGSETKLYGGASDPNVLTNNKGFIYVRKSSLEKKPTVEEKGVVIITISSKEVIFGVGSSDLAEARSVRAAAKTAALKAIASVGKYNTKHPKLAFLMSMPSSTDEAVRGAKEVLNRSRIIICGSAERDKFCMFAENRMYTNGVSMAVVYTNLPIGLNAINRSYRRIKMPPKIKNLLALRLSLEKV